MIFADEKMKEWIGVCVAGAIFLFLMFGLFSCLNEHDAKQRKWNKENPVEAAKKNCYSKTRGSRPSCWSEADWIVYCERVQCKQ